MSPKLTPGGKKIVRVAASYRGRLLVVPVLPQSLRVMPPTAAIFLPR